MNSLKIPKSGILEAEVVIVGAGGTGLAAAVEASEKGARVIVLEKRRTSGGNAVYAEGFFAAESPTQKRMMVDARRDDLFKKAMDYSHHTINPRIIRAFIDKSGDTADWLEKKGLSFELPLLYPNQVPAVWHVPPKGGAAVMKVLMEDCKNLGVPVLFETAAKKILTDKDGSAVGVLAVRKGAEIRIEAKSVIIATGGYGGNKKLMKKYYPAYSEKISLIGLPHTGDGITMATEIGADTEGMGVFLQGAPTVRREIGGKSPSWSLPLTAVVSEPNMVWVNKKGERFVDECITFNIFESVNPIMRQPDHVSYSLFDENIKQNIINKGLIKGLGKLFVAQGKKLTDLETMLQSRTEDGAVRIADTWDEIADWMGASPDVLKSTIDEYNRFCDEGYDSIFAKDRRYLQALRTPPYYAIISHPNYATTIGGIRIDHNMQVINKQGNPIPGLYAGGDTVGGWESETYCGDLSGSAFGFALNSGRIAAGNAVKYASGK